MLFPSAVLGWSTFIACLEAPPAALEPLLLTLLPERSRVRERKQRYEGEETANCDKRRTNRWGALPTCQRNAPSSS